MAMRIFVVLLLACAAIGCSGADKPAGSVSPQRRYLDAVETYDRLDAEWRANSRKRANDPNNKELLERSHDLWSLRERAAEEVDSAKREL